MIRRFLAAATVLVVAAILLIAAWPQLFGLERVIGIAQLVSLRALAELVAGIGVVLFLAMALLSKRMRRLAATLALMLLVFAGVTGAVLAIRGTASAGFPSKAANDLTILSWNTLGDAPGATEIARLAIEQKADIVSLPETSTATAGAVRDLMGQAGIPMQLLSLSFGTVATSRTTSLLISTKLGVYRRDDGHGSTSTLPSVIAVSADGTGPTIIAAHPIAPVPGEMTNWRSGLSWLAARCGATATAGHGTILAGDLNSTLDHWSGLSAPSAHGQGDLGACHDGARAEKAAAVGSWPTQLPSSMGTPIDHVLASVGWTFVGFRVITTEDGAGSDHRPVVAQLRPSS